MAALRWEPTHVTKHCPRVVPLQVVWLAVNTAELPRTPMLSCGVTNFIRPYLHQISIDSHSLNGYGKPLKRPFDRYQSRLEAISNGQDIRQINW